MEEIFKDIKGFEGYYQVSNLGNVKSLSRKSGNTILRDKILKPRKHTNGYLIVSIGKDYKHKNYSIHRLVASVFINNKEGNPVVNHIDENKENNNVNNLEWCTNKHNANHNNMNMRKWNGRRKKFKVIDLLTNEEKFYNNNTSYEEMEKAGYKKHTRSRVCKSKEGKYIYKKTKLIVLLDKE